MYRLARRFGTLCAGTLLMVSAASPVRAGWQWLHPTPQGHNLNDVEFLSASTAIAVGDAGTILVSHDAGVTWSAVNKVNGIASRLNKIARIDDTTAIVVGGGVVLKTVDGGTSWQERPSGTTTELIDVDFGGQMGMAVSTTRVVQSLDGGDSWVVVPWSVDFAGNGPYGGIDVTDGMLARLTQDFVFWTTSDGGLTWDDQFLPNYPFGLSEISFADASNGLVTASYGELFITTDGGSTWILKVVQPSQSETGISATDIGLLPNEDIVLSASAGICDVYSGYRCSYYGEAQVTSVGAPQWDWDRESTLRPLLGVACSSNGVRLFVGNGGAIHRWAPPAGIEQTAGSEQDDLPGGAVTFSGTGSGIAVETQDSYYWSGYEHSIFLRTSDGGLNWTPRYLWDAVIDDVIFAPGPGSPPPAYAVGLDTDDSAALILKSTDGGASWAPLWTDAAVPRQRAIDFAAPGHAVSVGDGGSVVVIDNDVATPSTQAPGAWLRSVAFATPVDGVAVGASGSAAARVGVILRTGDGGATWAQVSNNATDWLYGVDFATSLIGVAVGSRGAVLRTTNGGASWSVLAPVSGADLHAVRFLDETHGFIGGTGGTVLETSSGGASWAPLETPTTYSLSDIEAFGTTGACFSGPGFNILSYDQTPVPTLISRFDALPGAFGVDLSWEIFDASDLDHFRIVRQDLARPAHLITSEVAADHRSFRDANVTAGSSYRYQLFPVDRSGDQIASAPVTVTIPAARVALLPNVPNPFNPVTTLRFVVPARAHVTLAIYDVAGRHVTTLVDAVRAAGINAVEWNGTDAKGNPVASGVYVSRLRVGNAASVSRTMVLLK